MTIEQFDKLDFKQGMRFKYVGGGTYTLFGYRHVEKLIHLKSIYTQFWARCENVELIN